MKLHIILLCLFLLITNILISQNATVSLGNVIANPGDEILMPVYVSGFTDVGTFGFKLKYDSIVLKYINTVNINENFPGLMSNYIDSENILAFAWGPMVNGVTIPDGKLMDIKFKFAGNTTDIKFDAVHSVIYSSEGIKFNANYISGKVEEKKSGINDINNNYKFEIYPNPACSIIRIKPLKFNTYEISIYTINGQQVLNKMINNASGNNITTINISSFNEGIYLIKLSQKNCYFIQKFAVKFN